MNRRMQIVISSRPSIGPAGTSPPLTFWQRFKLLIIGIAMAVIAVAVLVAALIFGSILAAVLWIALVAVIVVVIIKAMFRRVRS
jgi:membrane protein YdbS with pleckstrin-like domain